MKKLLIIPVLLLFTMAANAQMFTILGKEIGFVYLGPKIGSVFSSMSNAESSFSFGETTVKTRTGFQFGFVGKFSLTPNFSIQPEVTFYQKGVKYETTGASSKIKTGYIGIPIIAKYALAKIGVVKIHLAGGAYSNIRTGGTWEVESATFSDSQPLDNAGWKRMDYGFAIGGGFEYEQEKGIWAFDIRYDQSFVDVHKSDPEFNSNRSIGLTVTYLFDFVDLYKRMKEKKKKTTN